MRIVANELHCLVNGDSVVPLVTDDERGFEAIEENLPKVKRLLCWNHDVCHAVKKWLKQHAWCFLVNFTVPITVQHIVSSHGPNPDCRLAM